MEYKISEIFSSWQGEGLNTGVPATFIRLAGCNLSCAWCDTDYSLKEVLTIEEIISRVQDDFVILTGGEPTEQNIYPLVEELQRNGFGVGIESNGTNKIEQVIDWISVAPKTIKVNHEALMVADEIKIVIDGNDKKNKDLIELALKHIPNTQIWLQPEGNKERCIKEAMRLSKLYNVRMGHQIHILRGWK